jgi:Ca2+-dependent lipid-binding protein
VLEAQALRNTDRLGKSSPYVTVQLIRGGGSFRDKGNKKKGGGEEESPLLQTPYVRHELNPSFDCELRFNVSNLVGLQLEVNVYNWSRYLRHVLMGTKIINISGIASSRQEDLWLQLDAPSATSPPPPSSSSRSSNEHTSPVKRVEVESYGRLHMSLSWMG